MQIFKRIYEKMIIYKFEKSNVKADFFQNAHPEKESERILAALDSMHNVFKQFLHDPNKFFYYLTTNLVVSFLHIKDEEKDEFQTIVILSGKNKNLCRMLEKESSY